MKNGNLLIEYNYINNHLNGKYKKYDENENFLNEYNLKNMQLYRWKKRRFVNIRYL